LITGGTGFIGSHLVETFIDKGFYVTILDNLSSGNRKWLEQIENVSNLNFVLGDILDYDLVNKIMVNQDEVWHLAGNADIPLGVNNTQIDLETAVTGTRNVLEAMVKNNVKTIIFTSSGSVYGNLAANLVSETSGPLYPLSMYAAGKISAEAFISSYCHLFGLNGYIFRFGNVLGSRMPRGAIRDFLIRLSQDNSKLTILGDGKQAKSYFLVEDCIEGMLYIKSHVFCEKRAEIFNLGNPGTTFIFEIAKNVITTMGLSGVKLDYTNSEAWPGDQPVVNLDVSKVARLGWKPKRNSIEAVNEGILRMYKFLKDFN